MQIGSANSVDKAKLLGLVRHYANGDANDPADADIIALLNRGVHELQVWIMDVYPVVRLKATENSVNLVAGTDNYAFFTDYVSIEKIEVNYSGNDNDWRDAKVVDLRQIPGLKNLNDTADRVSSGIPVVYVYNNRIYLKDPPANSVTGGMIVYGADIQTELTSTSTDEPAFPEHFHEGLCQLTAYKHLLPKNSDLLPGLAAEIVKLRSEIVTYFTRIINTPPQRVIPRHLRTQRQYR